MPRTSKLLLTFALLAGSAADARAQSGVRPAPQPNPESMRKEDDGRSRVLVETQTLEAEQLCARGHDLVAAGGGETSGARDALGRGLKLYLDAFVKQVPVGPGRAVASSFRETMRAWLKGAPQCVEDYLRVGGVAAGFERSQLEAFRGQALLLSETDESRTVFLGPEVDERIRILHKPEPAFPRAARGRASSGSVRVRAVLAADGAVRHVFVIKGSPFGFNELCVAAAKAIRFEPAVKDGRPVSQFVTLEYKFHSF